MKGLEKVPTKLVTLALSESPPDSELLGLRNPLLPSAAYAGVAACATRNVEFGSESPSTGSQP